MSKDKQLLVKSIGGIKSRITLFGNQIDKSCDTLTLGELRSMANRLNPLYSKYDEAQTQLEVIDSENSYETEREAFETAYGNVEAKIINLIEKLSKSELSSVNTGQSSSSTASSSNDGGGTVSLPHIPLPEMRLPEFDGNFMNWYDFSQIYTEVIHNNPRVSDIVKFQYLRSSLEKGSAFHFIKGVVPSQQTYANIWKSLSEFYKNEARLKYGCMKELYYLKPIKKENDAVALRMFIDNFWKQYNALKSLEIPVEIGIFISYFTYQSCWMQSRGRR